MNDLQQSIDSLLDNADLQKLKKSSQAISTQYREGRTLSCKEELFAYLIVRMPATYAVLTQVLSQLPSEGSILDLGAGPGTVWWAARPLPVTAIEREIKFIELGKKIGSEATWIHADILSFKSFEPHDWVVFGYSLGELSKSEIPNLLNRCWQAAQKGVVIVEPGTPRGYQNMLFVRDYLIKMGGFVLAPCPHSNTCPLQSEWCHFAARLNRSFWHRQAKLASLPFEDEKFSYVIITKEKGEQKSRIIRPPKHHSGHTILSLCTATGLHNTTIARSQKELYKKARKATWGEAW